MESEKQPSKALKILKIVGNVLTYVFFAICIFVLFVSVTAKKSSDGASNLFGMQMRIVVSSSMEKCDQTDVSQFEIKDIPVKSVVFIETVPEDETEAKEWYDELKIGDVLTFRYYIGGRQETITHRIIDKVAKDDGWVITLEGDNKATDAEGNVYNTSTQTIDTTIPLGETYNFVIGKVTGVSYTIGLLITAMKSPVGIICIVIIPCLIIMGFEIYRLVSALTAKKREQQKAREAQKDNELEELKRRLMELERKREEPQAAEPEEKTEITEEPQEELPEENDEKRREEPQEAIPEENGGSEE